LSKRIFSFHSWSLQIIEAKDSLFNFATFDAISLRERIFIFIFFIIIAEIEVLCFMHILSTGRFHDHIIRNCLGKYGSLFIIIVDILFEVIFLFLKIQFSLLVHWQILLKDFHGSHTISVELLLLVCNVWSLAVRSVKRLSFSFFILNVWSWFVFGEEVRNNFIILTDLEFFLA
jgi:hypothetical protein